MRRDLILGALTSALLLAACADGDDHGHGPGGHAHDEEVGDHGAGGDEHGHEHAEEAHAEEDGHGHGGGIVVTDYSETAELFVEFPPLAVGRASEFAAHFTRLGDFTRVTEGRVTVRLAGGGAPEEVFTAGASPTPGIFRPVARPRHVGTRDLTVILEAGRLVSVHRLGEYTVHETVEAADASLADAPHEDGLIPFLKEQQWQVDFATAPVVEQTLFHSVQAPATISPAPGGDATLSAQTEGVVLAGEAGFPGVGDIVARGDVLVRIAPNLGGDQDFAGLVAEREAARAAFNMARTEFDRLRSLAEQGAVAQRRVEEARAALQTARARLTASEARLEAVEGGAAGGVAVRAPISGRIAQLNAGAGSYVQSGETLFRIVDTSRMRLVAQVAEIDASQLGQPQGAWFTLLGGDRTFDLADFDGRLVAAGAAVDPIRRTAPVIFQFDNSAGFAAGTLATARVRTSNRFDGPVIPANAVIDDAGQPVVFVMADGENWRRQPIRIAVRDGQSIGIASGVEPGERVATEGAYLIHLAASGPAEAGHGHAH
ncbi:efflux RND transporter periplasmic adaptor subunit [Marinicauda algicola]|uniref:Efflux RND transporter periplasmic adaptor subunit n=1 Tax=Marinicauda algicola TaxID=2029849 RepID=A0A4S2GYH0_9PROT|nr:efflux RND transporter periplasmic adaptor subunit [Marinicauda algicola]TGY88215.1 efflux RND transporter periplasmic adaptor subunit [Marinicauda algicola]